MSRSPERDIKRKRQSRKYLWALFVTLALIAAFVILFHRVLFPYARIDGVLYAIEFSDKPVVFQEDVPGRFGTIPRKSFLLAGEGLYDFYVLKAYTSGLNCRMENEESFIRCYGKDVVLYLGKIPRGVEPSNGGFSVSVPPSPLGGGEGVLIVVENA